MQGELACVEGISVAGLRADALNAEALSRMARLRVLVLDGATMDGALSGFRMPRMAVLSWRDSNARSLPFALETVKAAAVVDIAGAGIERLPENLQACTPPPSWYFHLKPTRDKYLPKGAL